MERATIERSSPSFLLRAGAPPPAPTTARWFQHVLFLLSGDFAMPMKRLALMIAAASLTVVSLTGAPPASGPVEFRAHDIEAKFPGGYAVAAVDVNKDGKLDVIGVSQRVPEIA